MITWTVTPPVSTIQEVVCARFGITLAELVSPRRDRRVVVPRMTAMWLARHANYTAPAIGRAFGGRHHTTILHAVRRIDGMIDTDPEFADRLEALIATIGPVPVPRQVARA